MRGRGAKINGRVGCEHDVDAAKECLAAQGSTLGTVQFCSRVALP